MNEPRVTGRIHARFEDCGGKTRLAHAFCAAPLKIAKPFAQGAGLSVMVMDASPGLLAGDHYELRWQLGEGARVHATTQGFTRVHPSHERPCELHTRIEVGRNACLESFPEPLMLYAGASLRQSCEVEMADGATLLMAEIWCAGRIGHGEEAFRFSSFDSRLRVRFNGELAFINQMSLRPQDFDPRSIGAWGQNTHAGSFYVFSQRVNASWPAILREAVDDGLSNSKVGVSLLPRHGVAALLLGRRACDLQEVVARLRQAAHRLLASSF